VAKKAKSHGYSLARVGERDGEVVGVPVGVPVGAGDGAALGLSLGAGVGLTLGFGVTHMPHMMGQFDPLGPAQNSVALGYLLQLM
jgi:hypothetical protein